MDGKERRIKDHRLLITNWRTHIGRERGDQPHYTCPFEIGKEKKKKKKKNGESCSVFIHISSSRTHARKPAEENNNKTSHTKKNVVSGKKNISGGIVPNPRER